MSPKWKVRLYGIGALTSLGLAASLLYFALTADRAQSSQPERSRQQIGRSAAQHPLQSEDAPEFSLKRMNGEPFHLDEHRGEVVVLNFWATWCPPCRKEIPGFIELQEEFGGEGFTIVGVSLDEEGFEAVRPYAKKMGINYPLVVDDGSVARKYGATRVLPTSFVIGPDGTVQYARRGYLPESVLRDRLKPLLKRVKTSS